MPLAKRLSLCMTLLVAVNAVTQQRGRRGSLSAPFSRQSGSELLRNMLVAEAYVVVGSNTSVYVLDAASFNIIKAASLISITSIPPASAQDQVLLCGKEDCNLNPVCAHTTSTFWSYSWSSLQPSAINNNTDAIGNVAGELVVDPQGNFIQSYGEDGIFALIGGQLLVSFSYRNCVYFVLQLKQGTTYQIRVAKVWRNSTAVSGESLQNLSHEVPLTCQAPGQSSSAVSTPTAASFFPSSSAFNYDPTIVVSSVIAGNSYLCAYSLTTINMLMNEKYNACVNGAGMTGLSRIGNTVPCDSYINAEPSGNVTSGVSVYSTAWQGGR